MPNKPSIPVEIQEVDGTVTGAMKAGMMASEIR